MAPGALLCPIFREVDVGAGGHRLDVEAARELRPEPQERRIVGSELLDLLRQLECRRVLAALDELSDLGQRLLADPAAARLLAGEEDRHRAGDERRGDRDEDVSLSRRRRERLWLK